MPECLPLDCCEANAPYEIYDSTLLNLRLLADPEDGGTLTGEGSYNVGDEVTITATPAIPTSIDVAVDMVFVMDESASMNDIGTILSDVTSGLEARLQAAGIGTGALANRYAAVAFGHGATADNEIPFTDADAFVAAAISVGPRNLGALTEDGYEGIDFAINNLTWREPGPVARIIYLITDEDRNEHLYTDGADQDEQFASLKAQLLAGGYILIAMVNESENSIRDVDEAIIIAADYSGIAYLPDGSGGNTESTGAHPVGDFWHGETAGFPTNQEQEYYDLALDTDVQGYYISLAQYRLGGQTQASIDALTIDMIAGRVVMELAWTFNGWYNEGGALLSMSASYTFTIHNHQTITARFTHA